MGAHAEWMENLVEEIDSMYQLRAKENELRKVQVNQLLSDARDLVTKLHHEGQQRARELGSFLGEFGADVRAAADVWLGRSTHSTGERSRPAEFEKPQGKREKKKGKQR